MEYQAELNQKYMPVLHCISRFEGTSYNKLQDMTTSSFTACCFTSAFTSADIIFYNFSELDSKLYIQKFCHKFPFFNRFKHITPYHPHPLGRRQLTFISINEQLAIIS